MTDKHVKNEEEQENMQVELGGMGLYGTTSNKEIAGYEISGDIENAGQLDKGFKSPVKTLGPPLPESNKKINGG